MGLGSSKSQSQNQSQQQSTQQSQSSSESFNQSYPFLQGSLGGTVGDVSSAGNLIKSLLGLNGSDEGRKAFDTYKSSSGYDFLANEGMRKINSNNASKGLLGSGSALRAITDYSSGLASTFLDKYITGLQGIQNNGLSAAQILAGAGNVSKSSSSSSGTSSGTSYGNSTGKSTNLQLG